MQSGQVDETKEVFYSASQLKTWKECNRKWAWEKIAGIRTASGKGAALGSEVHEALESYLRTGELDTSTLAGYIASAGLHMLPERNPWNEIERSFSFYEDGIGFAGRKDLQNVTTVYDFKTSSNIERYGLTEETLKDDVQAIIYAKDYFNRNPVAEQVWVEWLYFGTANAKKWPQLFEVKTKPVRLPMLRTHVDKKFEEIKSTAKQIDDERATGKAPLEYAPNPGACENYGGCPFRYLCNLGPSDRFQQAFPERQVPEVQTQGIEEKNMGYIDDLRKNVAAEPGQVNPPESKLPEEQLKAEVAKIEEVREAEKPAVVEEKPKKESKAKKEPKEVKESKPISTLYVDCIPIGESAIMFETMMEKVRASLLVEHQLADFRFAEYGRGPAILAQTLAKLVDSGEYKGKSVCLNSRTPEGAACLQILWERADFRVRGV